MSAKVASSALSIPHSRIRELGEIALGMEGVLRLSFGESSVPTPDYIKCAAQQALADGFTFYTQNAGLPSLRQALAEYYKRLHGIDLDPGSEFVVSASGVQALNVAIRCTIDPGDEALVLTPAWPVGASIVQMFNAKAIEVAQPLKGERYTIDFDALESAVTPRTRLLLYTSPSNPLGWTATVEEQQKLLDFARKHNLWIIADEVYERLNFTGNDVLTPAPSILRLATRDDAVVVIQSFSKAWCMTGWRLGWMVGRKDLIARATLLNEFVVSHAPSFLQKAAETVLRDGESELLTMLTKLRHNRDFCLQALRKIPGVTVPDPDGAFYLFPRLAVAADSFAFCKRLLLEAKVGIAPGMAFGNGGEGSIRICYAAEKAIMEEAMHRITRFLQ
ncbi:MAG: pyridoxal phosphate-dependent aminotransferase [Pseudomonadota bacterium]|nr:pyridoxal phosphate-dependent aminotransferase [Pseudomonadota bacterium]